MAYLTRKPTSPFWIACFADHLGVKRQRSTKEKKDRKKALETAELYESTARGRPNERQIRKVLGELYREAHNQELKQETIRGFLTRWSGDRARELKASTFARYKTAIEKFLGWLGERADRDLGLLGADEIMEFRNTIGEKLSPRSANIDLKILRIALGRAEKDRLLPNNPAKDVAFLRVEPGHGDERRPITTEEIERLLAVADAEWRGLIRAGHYTGQRLGDIARLKWRDVRFDIREIWITTGKTGRLVQIPVDGSFLAELKKRAEGATPDGPVFPRAFKTVAKSAGQVRQLSNQFHRLLENAGLAEKRSKASTGAGHGARRRTSALSFHSLRHTFTSNLKNAGASEAVAMDLVGHDSPEISRNYTHISSDAKRHALKQLPSLGREKKAK